MVETNSNATPAKRQAAPAPEAPQHDESLGEIADGILCAINILNDLLKLAFRECPAEVESPCMAGSVILAASKFVDDIESLNSRLYRRQAAELRAEFGAAA